VGGLIGGAPLLIEILYDPRYRGVAPFLQLLAIAPLLRMSALSANEAMLALGYTRSTFLANIFRLIWLAIGGTIGLTTGHIMLIVATVGTIEVPGLLCFWWNLRRVHLLNLREESYGLIAGVAGVGVGWIVARFGIMLIAHV
jgi:O-antigen/teichoic acid export membrane protein